MGGDIISNFSNVEKKHFATSKVPQVLQKGGNITVFTMIYFYMVRTVPTIYKSADFSF